MKNMICLSLLFCTSVSIGMSAEEKAFLMDMRALQAFEPNLDELDCARSSLVQVVKYAPAIISGFCISLLAYSFFRGDHMFPSIFFTGSVLTLTLGLSQSWFHDTSNELARKFLPEQYVRFKKAYEEQETAKRQASNKEWAFKIFKQQRNQQQEEELRRQFEAQYNNS